MIANIGLHSNSTLPAFVVSQIYKDPSHDNLTAHVSVCDSGVGILNNLRPSLQQHYPEYQNLSDDQLIYKVFEIGVSSRGKEQGCGLFTCAIQALKFNASINVRLLKSSVRLKSDKNNYKLSKSYELDNLFNLQGTYISFKFDLASLTNQLITDSI